MSSDKVSSNKALSQKDYLKKYLSKSKKKLKKKTVGRSNVHVIDDNDIGKDHYNDGDEDLETGEDAPLIAAVIDERPTAVQRMELYKTTDRWAPVPEVNGDSRNSSQQKTDTDNREDRVQGSASSAAISKIAKRRPSTDNDLTTRKHNLTSRKKTSTRNSSPSHVRKSDGRERSKYDSSPPRKKQRFEKQKSSSPPRTTKSRPDNTRYPNDASPPRKSTDFKSRWDHSFSPRRENRQTRKYSSEGSPPRIKYSAKDERLKYTSNNRDSSNKKHSLRGPTLEVRKKDRNGSPLKKTSKKYSPHSSPSRDRVKEKKTRDLSPVQKKLGKHSSDSSPSPSRDHVKQKDRKGREAPSVKKKRGKYSSDSSPSPSRDRVKQKGKKICDDSPVTKKKRKHSDSPSPSRDRVKTKEKERVQKNKKKRDSSPKKKKRDRSSSSSSTSPDRVIKKGKKEKNKREKSSDSSPSRDRTIKKRKKDGDSSSKRKKRDISSDRSASRDRVKSKKDKRRENSSSDRSLSPDRMKSKKKNGDSSSSKKKREKHSPESSPNRDRFDEKEKSKKWTVKRDNLSPSNDKDSSRKKRSDKDKNAESSENPPKPTAEQFYQWGKGLKQIEDENEKLRNDLHEMSKPLARYRDDEDLDKHLKFASRDGDPLAGMKSDKDDGDSKSDSKPRYKGPYPPNRFNITPGHKWDGVDRSNGYEVKYLGKARAKEALEEEAYKWSTADM